MAVNSHKPSAPTTTTTTRSRGGFALNNRVSHHQENVPSTTNAPNNQRPAPVIVDDDSDSIRDDDIPLSITPKRKITTAGKFTVQHVNISGSNSSTAGLDRSGLKKSPQQRLRNFFSFRPDLNRQEQSSAAHGERELQRDSLLMEDARAATFLVDKDRGDKVNSLDLRWRVKCLAVACYLYHSNLTAVNLKKDEKKKTEEKEEEEEEPLRLGDARPGSLYFTRCLLEDVDVMFDACMAAPELPDAESGAVLAFNTTAKQLGQMCLWRKGGEPSS